MGRRLVPTSLLSPFMSRMYITQSIINMILSAVWGVLTAIVATVWYARWFKDVVYGLKKDFDKHCEESDVYRKKADEWEIALAWVKADLSWIKTMLLKIDERMQN